MKDSTIQQSGNVSAAHPAGDAAELAAALEPVKERLAADLQRQLDLAGNHRSAAKTLERDLKALSTGLAIISGEQPLAVSLLYKRAGSGAYIKGRCWWNGRQREVQIGSIPAVLAAVPKKHAAPYAGKAAPAGWNEIRGDELLTAAIKEIGRRKLRELIARRLMEHFSGEENRIAKMVPETATAEPIPLQPDTGTMVPDSNGNWYAHWRAINLGLEAGS